MSTFLRWGVFGILGVAALLYAYNASKRLAEAHAARAARAAAAVPSALRTSSGAQSSSERPARSAPAASAAVAAVSASPECEAEVEVARRAVDMRKRGEPLDRVLRLQEIAWQASTERRMRLGQVATRWYGYEGDFRPETLRIAALNDCEANPPRP